MNPSPIKDGNVLFSVSNLCAGYGDVQVLQEINLTVHSGKTVAILGPNGHGKTTALRTISGLHRTTSGSIVFDGVDISQSRPNRIAALGLVHVPQGDLLFSDMTVLENLQVGAYIKAAWGQRRERLDAVWSIFPELYERRNSLARHLSGGERRMTALGRALMANAKLLMIDEPSLGLAPVAIQKMYGALTKLKEQGLSMLLVEEAADRIADIADHLCLLDSGTIVREGPTKDILEDRVLLETYLG